MYTHLFTELLNLVVQNKLELFQLVVLLFELENSALVLRDRLVAFSNVLLKQLLWTIHKRTRENQRKCRRQVTRRKDDAYNGLVQVAVLFLQALSALLALLQLHLQCDGITPAEKRGQTMINSKTQDKRPCTNTTPATRNILCRLDPALILQTLVTHLQHILTSIADVTLVAL